MTQKRYAKQQQKDRNEKGDFIGNGMEANLAEKAIFDQCTTPLSRISSSAIF